MEYYAFRSITFVQHADGEKIFCMAVYGGKCVTSTVSVTVHHNWPVLWSL